MIRILVVQNQYKGYETCSDDDIRLPELYSQKNVNWFNLLENEYLLITDKNGNIVDKYKWQEGKHKNVFSKSIDSSTLGKTKPKNSEQALAIDMLMDDKTTVKVLSGTFGSGKTYLSCACAYAMLQAGKFEKIVWIRNNIEVKDSKSIGYLKGDFFDKMYVWAAPLADHIGGMDMLERQIQYGTVEIVHLGFLRGRDIKNSIIFCSEAEHLTREHVQLLLGRVAEGSILVLEGDWRQIDGSAFERDNGLLAAINCLKGNKLFSYVHLSESVRSETAKLADLLDLKST